jgi:hypothetical protein
MRTWRNKPREAFTLIIEATVTKNGKETKLPVPDAPANLLRPWLADKMEGEKLWPGLWHDDAAEMLRKDLKAAGIEYETKAGVLDFHATRHTAITQGSRVMNVVDLKAFARHAKIETTMRYVHTQDQALRNGVEKLPSIGVSNGTPMLFQSRSKKCDHKCDRAGVSETQVGSTSSKNWQSNEKSRNDTTPCKSKGLASKDIDCHQRARRGSNPQPPDRQSATSIVNYCKCMI